MFDFSEFEGPDGWERFIAFKDAMHIKAVDEFFEDLRQKAEKKGEKLTKITYGSELKDGTRLSRKDALLWSKRSGFVLTEKTRNSIDDRFAEMVEELSSK